VTKGEKTIVALLFILDAMIVYAFFALAREKQSLTVEAKKLGQSLKSWGVL